MKSSASESVYLERLRQETRLWSEFGTALVQTPELSKTEVTISNVIFWSKWVVLSFLVNPVAQTDFVLLRFEWKYKTMTFSLLELVIFTVEIESSQCLGKCMRKQVCFFKVKPFSRRWGFSTLTFPLPILCKFNDFLFNWNFSLKVVKNKKIDYVKPVKHLEIFKFERFEYSYSKHVFSKETKSNNAFKLLLVFLLHFGNSGINI